MAKYVIDIDENEYNRMYKHDGMNVGMMYDAIHNATPLDEEFEWCHDCKEYDTEKHCCHRWTKVIRNTLKDNINSVLEEIKADIDKAMEEPLYQHEGEDWGVGLVMARDIIDNHINGKE